MRMRWFGDPWPSAEARAPVCDDDLFRVPTPAGKVCINCEGPIYDGDQGVVMAASFGMRDAFKIDVGSYVYVAASHVACLLHATVGYGDRWLRHEWGSEHAADCPVTRYRAQLLRQLAILDPERPDYEGYVGAVPEYEAGGDQEAELCECGVVPPLTAEEAAAIDHAPQWGVCPGCGGRHEGACR